MRGERERERETKEKHEEPHQNKRFQVRNTSHKPPKHTKKKTVLTPRRWYWSAFYINDQPDDNDDKTHLLALRTYSNRVW